MNLKICLLAACLAMSAAAPAYAWDQIGVRTVRDHTDRDTITLSGHRMFSRIKLCVARNHVHFYDLDVRFNNGANQDVSVRTRIPAGGCTRVIDLNGGPRDIASISMLYEETSFRRRTATVRVWAE